MTYNKYILYAAISVALIGCSSSEDKIYESFKCGRAATLLDRDDLAAIAAEKAKSLLKEVNMSSRDIALLGQRFQDEYPLYRYNAKDQLEIIIDLFKSSDCASLFEELMFMSRETLSAA